MDMIERRYKRFAARRWVAAGIAAVSLAAASQAFAASSTQWILSYEGKSTNRFIWDKRTRNLVETRLPAGLSDDVLAALGGPPEPVFVSGHRYVSVAACVPHDCDDKGFFWIDTKTGIGLGAHYAPEALLLGSNGLSAEQIPAPARQALIDWLTENALKPESVAFVGNTGARTALDPSGFQARASYQPPAGGPSFDCARASSQIDKAICGDAELAALDLKLAQLFKEIRQGHDTVGARSQLVELQRTWLHGRNADCAHAPDLAACLKTSYRAQHERLMNWIPK